MAQVHHAHILLLIVHIVINIVIVVMHNRVTSGPWKELANTNDFYDAPPSQPEMEDGSMPIDGVAYCDAVTYNEAIAAGRFYHEQPFSRQVPAMDLLYSTSRTRAAPKPRTKKKLKPEGPPPTPHDLEWLYNQIDGTFLPTCLHNIIVTY